MRNNEKKNDERTCAYEYIQVGLMLYGDEDFGIMIYRQHLS